MIMQRTYAFTKLDGRQSAAHLLTECRYYGIMTEDRLAGMDMYGMVDGEELIACVGIVRQGAQAYLDYLAVADAYRNEGLASELLTKTRVDLRKRGVRIMHTCISGKNQGALKLMNEHGAVIGWPYVKATFDLEDDHGN